MDTFNRSCRVAVVGAGLAGATCARALTDAGLTVQVYDKARGSGGRMATRRAEWVDAQGRTRQARFDHGAPGFGGRTPAFLEAARQAEDAGWLAQWAPVTAPVHSRSLCLSPGSSPGEPERTAEPADAPFVGLPDMPQWCRGLLDGLPGRWGQAVDALKLEAGVWRLHVAGDLQAEAFDRVVLAMPPLQAAALLAPHRPDWAARASVVPMQPCWTLMGLTDALAVVPAWQRAEPKHGPLGRVLRQDARPGRPGLADEAGWVVHAHAAWSRDHLEDPPDVAQSALQQALADFLGEPLRWRHAVVHRWRYALPPTAAPGAAVHWWDGPLGLGVCGDFLGGTGVEGAWLSGRAVADALLADLRAGVAQQPS